MSTTRIAILGAGNIGKSIAEGLLESGTCRPGDLTLTRRKVQLLSDMKQRGVIVHDDNQKAIADSTTIIIAVEPQQLDEMLREIGGALIPGNHVVISVVTGVTTDQIVAGIGKPVAVVRAMPNTAISVRESMTCLASNGADEQDMQAAKSIFDAVGMTQIIAEDEMIAATALGACGIAFFLRAIRAASQGGIEIGFHSRTALIIAAQTAKGAATLMQKTQNHPEFEIDKVTTPRGCTIAGVNQMEHEGFSSAMIKGITVSAAKAAKLYKTSR